MVPGGPALGGAAEIVEAHAPKTSSTDPDWAKLPWLLEHFPGHGASKQGESVAADDDIDMDEVDADEAGPLGDAQVAMTAEDVGEALYERRFHMQAQT